MSINVPEQVYENLVKLIEYRNAKMQSKKFTRSELIKNLNRDEYIIIEAERESDPIRGSASLTIVQFAKNSNYSTKSNDFEKLLNTLNKPKPYPHNIICISYTDLTTYMSKKIKKITEKNPKLLIEFHIYEKFLIEYPIHVLVPKHTLMLPDEIENYCNTFHFDKENLPKILNTDTQAVWLGAQPSMCIKIQRLSETAGIMPAIRYVVADID